jgi:phage repressor protein C with HTH and peptisase S24 domain
MLSHARIWAAIDALAARHSMSPSGLARRSGLDATAFNKSKRCSADGRPRWPSTESLAKIMQATGCSLDDMLALIEERRPAGASRVPLIGFAQAGAGGFFDDAGFPVGHGWEMVELPAGTREGAYALQVQGESMLPLYRDGDVLIIDPAARVKNGDRVVVRTRSGEVMAKILVKRGQKALELLSVNPDHGERAIPAAEVEWIARIVWASQ